MAFSVYFFSFSKKLNSTKRPPLETGKVMQCEIKDTCDIINPVLVLDGISPNIESDYNYCYIEQWTRYYYVTRYVFKDGYWNLHLSVDTLATWKSYIGASYQYIERAASGGDGSIVDNLTIGKGYATINNLKTYELFSSTETFTGTFVISVQGADPMNLPSNAGGVTYYALSATAMTSFISNMTDSANTTYTDISAEILKANLDPFQFLVDCKWYPIKLYLPATKVTKIKLGWFTVSLTGDACTIDASSFSRWVDEISIPKHPQYATTLGQYLNNSKFHSIYIFLPGVGLQKLESDSLVTASTLNIYLRIDMFTGDAQYRIYADTNINAPLYVIPATLGASIPLTANYAATSQRGGGLISSIVNTVAQVIFPSAATKHSLAEAQWGAETGNKAYEEFSKISTLANMMGNPSTLSSNYSGSMGSIAILKEFRHIVIYGIDVPVQLPAYSDVGYPVYAHKQIASMNGYIKIVDAHCEAPATDGELSEINTFLSGGFFYE